MERIRLIAAERRASLFVATLALLLAFTAAAASGMGGASSGDGLRDALSPGTLRLSTDATGGIVPALTNMKPGDVAVGAVTVRNEGTAPGRLTVGIGALRDARGPGGGDLSRALRLTIIDRRNGAVVYEGPLAGMGARALGILGPRKIRTFLVRVVLPDHGAPPGRRGPADGDNALQGGRVAVDFAWLLVAAPGEGV